MSSTRKYITANEEVDAVPPEWEVRLDGESGRVSYYQIRGGNVAQQGTYEHPIFGWLPRPWQLNKEKGSDSYVYYNPQTGEKLQYGPRKVARPPSPPPGAIRVRKDGMGELVRLDISRTHLRDEYKRVSILDDPGGAGVGGMNNGVYLVRSQKTGQLYVEKTFLGNTDHRRRLVKREIMMMRTLLHNAIIHYIAGYIQDDPFDACVIMEHCDRGSLGNLIDVYKPLKKQYSREFVPEGFIWHCFIGLIDALAYLQTGQSAVSMELQKNDPKCWKPIVHCDIKPDNIFIRSRDTPGSQKPFYVLLSDFGLMDYEWGMPTGPQGLSGTIEYHAPELAFDPMPSDEQFRLQYQAGPHTGKSDVWSIACCMFCLCERERHPHLDRNKRPFRSQKMIGRKAKRPSLDITELNTVYSDYLGRAISWGAARDPQDRPTALNLVPELGRLHDAWNADPLWQGKTTTALPDWAAPKRV
ncbi:kinase-like protein [Xylariaceae sp. FL0255]|nr:kinase-like protein [Xylariaceae sp. FL0255]